MIIRKIIMVHDSWEPLAIMVLKIIQDYDSNCENHVLCNQANRHILIKANNMMASGSYESNS